MFGLPNPAKWRALEAARAAYVHARVADIEFELGQTENGGVSIGDSDGMRSHRRIVAAMEFESLLAPVAKLAR